MDGRQLITQNINSYYVCPYFAEPITKVKTNQPQRGQTPEQELQVTRKQVTTEKK